MKSNLPDTSLLKNNPRDYADSYSTALDTREVRIEQVGKAFFTSSPAWVDGLFDLRNRIVALLGLKTSGAGERDAVMRNFKGEVGERIGLFNVLAKWEDEVILGEDDRHLDFRVSLFLDRPNDTLIVSTLVIRHNWLGRLYFLLIKPFHRLIVSTIIKRMVRQLGK